MLSKNPANLHEAQTIATEIWCRNNNGKNITPKAEISAIREDQSARFSTEHYKMQLIKNLTKYGGKVMGITKPNKIKQRRTRKVEDGLKQQHKCSSSIDNYF